MPRRAKIERRVPKPDPRYNSELVARVINKVMQRGKKGLAERIMYGALQIIQERTRLVLEPAPRPAVCSDRPAR